MKFDAELHEKMLAAVRGALEAVGLDVIRNAEFFGMKERPQKLKAAA